MNAVRRLHVVPEPEPVIAPEPKPDTRGWPIRQRIKRLDPRETQERAAWASFLTRDAERRDHTDLADLREIARAVRSLSRPSVPPAVPCSRRWAGLLSTRLFLAGFLHPRAW